MNKYVLIFLTIILITIPIYLGFKYFQNNSLQNTVTTRLNTEGTNSELKDYILVDNNFKIKQTIPNKTIKYENRVLTNILIPNSWEVLEPEIIDFFSYSNENELTEFIYLRRFYIETDPKGIFGIDIIKSSGYTIEQTLGPELSKQEANALVPEIYNVNKEYLRNNKLIDLNTLTKISQNFSNPSNKPIDNMNFIEDPSLQERQIKGQFNFTQSFQGNNRIVHEYKSSDNHFVWLLKDSENSFIYAYGYLYNVENSVLFRVLFLNLE